MAKKGLSNIIAIVLLVLVALAAVIIVWNLLIPILFNSGENVRLQNECLQIELKPTTCAYSFDGTNYDITDALITQGKKEILAISAVIVLEDKTTAVRTQNAPGILGSINFAYLFQDLTSAPKSLKASAVIRKNDGSNFTCESSPIEILCGSSAVSQQNCGNNIIDNGEECDTNTFTSGADCTAYGSFSGGQVACTQFCTLDTSSCTVCGDGICDAPQEDQASCSQDCGAQSTCGNGFIEQGEACDDGNIENNDGCSNVCQIENGYSCVGEPSICTNAQCGNNIIESPEECDNTNLNNKQCHTLASFAQGILSCYSPSSANECTFNTTQCIPCSAITNCAGYTSQTACQANNCNFNVPNGCRWSSGACSANIINPPPGGGPPT